MPLTLVDLPMDTLVLLCEWAVRDGEAYWMAATCIALRQAVASACKRLGAPLCSRAATACLTLPRLETAMTLERFRELVHVDTNATSLEARPRSLDRKWVWSPAGERVLAALAPPWVLDYAWAGWRLSLEAWNPGCFLVSASAAGRVDLLREMDQSAKLQKLAPALEARTLQAKLTRSVSFFWPATRRMKLPERLDWVESALLIPALRSGNTAAIRWYYERMDNLQGPLGGPDCEWRQDLSRGVGQNGALRLGGLVRAAATGRDPYAALEFLSMWMWPRLGSRAPSSFSDALARIASDALRCALDSTRSETVGVWAWLQRAVPQGASDLFNIMRYVANVHVSPLYRRVWVVRNVDVYRWISERLDPPHGWMHALFGAPPFGHLGGDFHADTGGSHRLLFAHMTLVNIASRRDAEDVVDPEAVWDLDRDLAVQSLSDAFVYSVEGRALAKSKCAVGQREKWQKEIVVIAIPCAVDLIKYDASSFVAMAVETATRIASIPVALRQDIVDMLATVVKDLSREAGGAKLLSRAQCAELQRVGIIVW